MVVTWGEGSAYPYKASKAAPSLCSSCSIFNFLYSVLFTVVCLFLF